MGEINKRFKLSYGIKPGTNSGVWDTEKKHNQGVGDELWIGEVVDLLNQFNDENERLKLELKKYHKRFDCHQCHYHNYDGLNIDDEYEVCDKGNNEALDDNHSCSEWEEL